jgi:hypothetical protein
MISRENPVKASLTVLVMAFIVFGGVLWMLKPDCVQTIDRNGNEKVSIELVASFALTFALVSAIIVLLLFSKNLGQRVGGVGVGGPGLGIMGSGSSIPGETMMYF